MVTLITSPIEIFWLTGAREDAPADPSDLPEFESTRARSTESLTGRSVNFPEVEVFSLLPEDRILEVDGPATGREPQAASIRVTGRSSVVFFMLSWRVSRHAAAHHQGADVKTRMMWSWLPENSGARFYCE